MMRSKLLAAIAPFALTACVGPTTTWKNIPYELPAGVPSASLSNGLVPGLGKGDQVNITTPLDDCETIRTSHNLRSGVLFSMKDGEPSKTLTVQVPANQPLSVQYGEHRKDGRYCYVHVVVNLEPGKDYTLVGGYSKINGPIPVLLDKGGCSLGVLDNTTKTIVPSTRNRCGK